MSISTGDLLERIAALEADANARHAAQRRTRRRARWFAIAVVVLAAVAMPATMLASHLFNDVATSSTFHDSISRVFGARITTGCGVGIYCPTAPVTREQMAGFLGRGLGRIDHGVAGPVPVGTSETDITSATIRAGNVQGGTAFIQVSASGYAFTSADNATTCVPCQVNFYVVGGASTSIYGVATVTNVNISVKEIDSFAITWRVAVPTGVDQTFTLYADQEQGVGAMSAFASLTVTYVPFDGDGGNGFEAPAPLPGERGPGRSATGD